MQKAFLIIITIVLTLGAATVDNKLEIHKKLPSAVIYDNVNDKNHVVVEDIDMSGKEKIGFLSGKVNEKDGEYSDFFHNNRTLKIYKVKEDIHGEYQMATIFIYSSHNETHSRKNGEQYETYTYIKKPILSIFHYEDKKRIIDYDSNSGKINHYWQGGFTSMEKIFFFEKEIKYFISISSSTGEKKVYYKILIKKNM